MKSMDFSANLEKSLERLGQEVQEQKAKSPEQIQGTQDVVEKTVVKEAIRNFSEKISEQVIPQQAQSSSPTPVRPVVSPQVSQPQEAGLHVLPAYLENGAPQAKQIVEDLALMAFQKGVESAIKASLSYPPFIIDAFHDSLVEKLTPELKKRNLL